MTRCVVCNEPCVKEDGQPPITSRLTTTGMEVAHVACVPELPAAQSPLGPMYAAGSVGD